MISSSSLQAFSPGIGGTKPPATSLPTTRAAAPVSAAPAQKLLQALPQGAPSGRPSPRGSLLDLSV